MAQKRSRPHPPGHTGSPVTNLLNLVVWGCAGPLLLSVGSSLVAADGAAPHRRAFPCCGAQAPGAKTSAATAQRHGRRAPEQGCRSARRTRAWSFQGVWRLPRPWIEPTSPALAGGFLPPAPSISPTTRVRGVYD